MPDVHPLPPRPQLPDIAFDARGFDRAAAAARRRVRRAAALTSAATVVAAVVTVAPGDPTAGVQVTPAATVSARPPARAPKATKPEPGVRVPAPVRAPVPAAAPTHSEPPPSQTPEGHEPPPPEHQEPVVTETQRPDGYIVREVEERRQVSYYYPDDPASYAYVAGAAPAGCETKNAHSSTSVQGPTWAYDDKRAKEFCAAFTAPTTVVAGETAQFQLRICRSNAPGVTAHTLTAVKDGPLFWMPTVLHADRQRSWGMWRGDVPPETAIEVRPGDCAQWTYQWKAVHEGSKHGPLEPGDYDAELYLNMTEYRPFCLRDGGGDGCLVRPLKVTAA